MKDKMIKRQKLEKIERIWGAIDLPGESADQISKLNQPLILEMFRGVTHHVSAPGKISDAQIAQFLRTCIYMAGQACIPMYFLGYELAAGRIPFVHANDYLLIAFENVKNHYDEILCALEMAGQVQPQAHEETLNKIELKIVEIANAYIDLGIENYPKIKKKDPCIS